MTKFRSTAGRFLPLLLLLVLYWPSLTTWFFADDFGWLNLRHDVLSAGDLPAALFAPKAHGNMRPLGENLYWLSISWAFGADPLPFHICTFVTEAAAVMLLGAIVGRMLNSRAAAFAAQVLWVVNCGLAPSLGWSSIYNQVLCGFFLLLAFYLLVRYRETGRGGFLIAQWGAFALSLGALETSVVYPALAALYALLFARRMLGKVLPMFALSGIAMWLHFHFAPLEAGGAYSPRVDLRIFATFWTYWRWALGPERFAAFGWSASWVAVALTGLITVGAAGLVVWGLRRREYAGVFGLAWFAIALSPYLVLPDHKMDYYLAVPAIGVAIAGAWALRQVLRSGGPRRIAMALPLAAYLGTSLPASASIARWTYDRGEKVANLVLGVEQVRVSHSRGIILLDGIDNDLFWSGVANLPFRAMDLPGVYLAPGSEARIQAARDLLSKYVLPEAIARRALDTGSAVAYRFDGERLHNATGAVRALADSEWREDMPHLVNMGDPVFAAYLGSGWREAARGYRWTDGTATFTIGAPRSAAESLYLGVFRTTPFQWSVLVNGAELPATPVYRNTELSEFRVTLPAAAIGWKQVEVAVRGGEPLKFGYAEVR
ncbi:MAG: hypothetical protein JST11_07550 [Acidobacteria bacterium]|nr:hypothetical protein [Acidobacteriota bacterium]